VFLAASESRWLRERAVKVPFVRRAVRKFMPGETIDDALTASRELGVGTVLTRLGENLKSAGEAEGVARHYLEVLDRVAAEKLDVEISVKLTQLGLDFSREECERHLHELAERARSHGNWLWVDMESTAYTDVTLDIYRRLTHMTDVAEIGALREEVRDRFGVVPDPARNFFATALLRVLGGASDIESVLVRGNEARITFREHAVPRMKGISAAFHEVQFQAEVRRAHPLSLKLTRLGGAEMLDGLVRALMTLRPT